MPFPFYRQHDSMDCGPTCLRMIMKYYGRNVPVQVLREKAQIGREGVNLLGISETAESFGFRTQAVRLSFKTLIAEAALPCILYWDKGHFVVLFSKSKRRKGWQLKIADPAKGILTYTQEEFLPYWINHHQETGEGEGIALVLEPMPAFYQLDTEKPSTGNSQGRSAFFSKMFSYLLPYKKLLGQLLVGLTIAGILQLVLPFLTQSVVDIGINTANIHFVYIVLLAQLALFSGRLVIDAIRNWILLHISTRINVSILTDFLVKLMKLPVSFFESKNTGDILQRMNDHQRIELFLTGSSVNILFSLVNLLIFTVVLALFNGYIFFVFLAASILYSLWVTYFMKKRLLLDHKRFDIASREQNTMIQAIQGMQEIKLNGIEKSVRWNWEGLQAKLFRLNMTGLSLNQWQQSGALFINETKNILITLLSAKAVIDGQMTLGTMLAVQYIIGQLNSPIEQMINFVQTYQNARISMERLNEVHALEDEEPVSLRLSKELPPAFARQLTGGKKPMVEWGSAAGEKAHTTQNQVAICFENVSFTYPGAGNEPVLQRINLSVPKGKTTAIVGISGSGKTTLLKLLLKFYEPQQGDILLKAGMAGSSQKDAVSLQRMSHKSWRNHCGVVMQESFIFSDTIARNIAVGIENPDKKKLLYAATMANLHDFIESLPLGFNTKIGTEGIGISMGQKQRILIARAIYRDPEFIFFDEATNSLDANNESIILDNLDSFFVGRTVVVVAHRLSTVKNADQIIVLNKGKITEQGTHRQLIDRKGEYFSLVKNQLELGE